MSIVQSASYGVATTNTSLSSDLTSSLFAFLLATAPQLIVPPTSQRLTLAKPWENVLQGQQSSGGKMLETHEVSEYQVISAFARRALSEMKPMPIEFETAFNDIGDLFS